MSWMKVGSLNGLPQGTMKLVTVDDLEIALYHTEEGLSATSAVCTHASAMLTEGKLTGCIVECPKHGGKFDVRTGEPKALPCVIPVEVFPVDIRGEDVWVDV